MSTSRTRRDRSGWLPASAAIVFVLVLAPVASPGSPAGATTKAGAGGGARFVSPDGDDRAPGTRERPWRTIGKAVAALGPGQTAYLRAGVYVEATSGPCGSAYNAINWNRSGTHSAPITIAGAPGEEKRVVVKTLINVRGAWLRLRDLVLDRNTAYSSFDRTCTGSVNIAIYGRNDAVKDVVIKDAAMSGVYINDAENVTVARNVIRDNGTHRDLDHGIYVSSSKSLLVANNVIVRNLAYGIQFYKDPTTSARVLNNTVVANGRSGLVLSGDLRGTRVANNIFADNGDYGIREHDLSGEDNLGIANLYFSNGEGSLYLPDGRFESTRGIHGDPAFVRPIQGDFHLRARSRARDRGDAQHATRIDFDRKLRSRSSPDIGAYEG